MNSVAHLAGDFSLAEARSCFEILCGVIGVESCGSHAGTSVLSVSNCGGVAGSVASIASVGFATSVASVASRSL